MRAESISVCVFLLFVEDVVRGPRGLVRGLFVTRWMLRDGLALGGRGPGGPLLADIKFVLQSPVLLNSTI